MERCGEKNQRKNQLGRNTIFTIFQCHESETGSSQESACPIDPIQAANQGLIVQLDDLINKYAPNIKNFSGGKLYSLVSVVSGTTYTNSYGLLIRQGWLDSSTCNSQLQRTKGISTKGVSGTGSEWKRQT